jgi:tight adherence protein C
MNFNLHAYLPPLLLAIACALIGLMPLALKSRGANASDRDLAWRDRLPTVLSALRPLVGWYAAAVDDGLPAAKRDLLQKQLNLSGAGYLLTPAELIVVKRIALVFGIAAAIFVIMALDVRDPLYLTLAAGLAPLAFIYPNVCLRDAAKRRLARFEKDFPFFLDVLVLGMKAGLTFASAVEQSIDQVREGPVREEFSRYLREVRSGASRRAALDRVAERVAHPSVMNFVASVTQAEETGGSLGEVLADQARQRRQERFLRAEKLANQAPVKMLFPLIALLFPITFIIIGFPIVIQLIEAGAFEIF